MSIMYYRITSSVDNKIFFIYTKNISTFAVALGGKSPLMIYFQTPIQKGIKQEMGNGFVAAPFVNWDHLIFRYLNRYVSMIDFLILWYYYTILKVFLTLAWNWPIIRAKNSCRIWFSSIWCYTLNYSSKNTGSNSQVETIWAAIKLITRLKGLSHEMDFDFDEMVSMVSFRPRSHFLNFLCIPMILYRKKCISRC